MPVHNFEPPRGTLHRLTVDSRAVRDNLLGDPHRRTVVAYLSPGCTDGGGPYPLLVDLTGFTGSGPKHVAWQAFGESVPQRVDRLIEQGKLGPVVVAFPDCFTSLGGNQYINSAALGNWEDFLLEEMLPALEAELPVAPEPGHRAVFGKSSGGYGALVQGLRHGDHWGAVACHSGDMGFDLLYRGDFPKVLDALAAAGGGPEAFIRKFLGSPKVKGPQMHTLMLLAMAATYDPDPDAPFGVRLPVDPHTCELDERRWRRWLEHDPLQMIERPECRESLGRLRALYVDCGSRDQYTLHYGARAFVRRLEAAGIAHRYEEFDDDHTGIDYRMDISIPYLYDVIRSG